MSYSDSRLCQHTLLAALLLPTLFARSGAAEPTPPSPSVVKSSQIELRKCVTTRRPNAVLVLIRGFNWFSGKVEEWSQDRKEFRPDLWTINDQCEVQGQDGLYFADPNPFARKGTELDTVVNSLRKLYSAKKNQGRPLIVIGHSMGGAYLQEAVKKMMEAGIRPDLVIAVDAVSIKEQFLDRLSAGTRAVAKQYFGADPTVDLQAALPYAVAHLRASPTDKLDAANVLHRAHFTGMHQCVEYTIQGTGHTTIDGDPDAMSLVSYLISLVPERGLNRGVPATPHDYEPLKLPTKLDAFPPDLIKRFKDKLVIRPQP